jgi:hypothetical protein
MSKDTAKYGFFPVHNQIPHTTMSLPKQRSHIEGFFTKKAFENIQNTMKNSSNT